MKDYLLTLPQYLLPHHFISRIIGMAAASENPRIKSPLIENFARIYNVDMSQAAEENLSAYKSFNDFFTRALKDGQRPIDSDPLSLVSPADGAVSQLGYLQNDRLIQAKGKKYSAVELLGGSTERAAPFLNGAFATIYLSPRDYHRVHMPFSGTLQEMIYIPGKLFSVNQRTADQVDCLFARNERMVAIFSTELGPMALVMVGAMIVAGIETVWSGRITPPKGPLKSSDLRSQNIALEKGAEAGRFFLGSTAIMLMPANTVQWQALAVGEAVRMGQKIATLNR